MISRYSHKPANSNTIITHQFAEKLKRHPLKPILEELVIGIHETLSHIEDERSLYPQLKIMDIQKMSNTRYHDVLRDQQAINGPQYTITHAYTISVTFDLSNCLRPTYYDCIYYRNGEQHGTSFLPHESLLDILG